MKTRIWLAVMAVVAGSFAVGMASAYDYKGAARANSFQGLPEAKPAVKSILHRGTAARWVGYANLSDADCLKLLDIVESREAARKIFGERGDRPRLSTLIYGFDIPSEENLMKILEKARKSRADVATTVMP